MGVDDGECVGKKGGAVPLSLSLRGDSDGVKVIERLPGSVLPHLTNEGDKATGSPYAGPTEDSGEHEEVIENPSLLVAGRIPDCAGTKILGTR